MEVSIALVEHQGLRSLALPDRICLDIYKTDILQYVIPIRYSPAETTYYSSSGMSRRALRMRVSVAM